MPRWGLEIVDDERSSTDKQAKKQQQHRCPGQQLTVTKEPQDQATRQHKWHYEQVRPDTKSGSQPPTPIRNQAPAPYTGPQCLPRRQCQPGGKQQNERTEEQGFDSTANRP